MKYDFDLTYHFTSEELPLCPLCDQPIFTHENYGIVLCHNVVALAHVECAEDAL